MIGFSSSQYTFQENKTIYGQVIDSDKLVANRSSFSTAIAHSRWYVTPIEVNIKKIKSLRPIIKSDISVGKVISSIKYLHV